MPYSLYISPFAIAFVGILKLQAQTLSFVSPGIISLKLILLKMFTEYGFSFRNVAAQCVLCPDLVVFLNVSCDPVDL